MKTILLICCLILQNSCNGQKKEQVNDTIKMQEKTEKFEIETFERNEKGKTYSFLNKAGDNVFQQDWGDYYSEKITFKNSEYGTKSIFYKTSDLKEKGEFYKNIYIHNYYFYDENGKIIKKDDLEQFYTFTLEDVLNYLEKNDIKEVTNPPTGHEIKVHLWRTDSSKLTEHDPIFWEISYGLAPHIPKGQTSPFMCNIKITLDGKTGKELKKEYKRAKIDTEWTLIE